MSDLRFIFITFFIAKINRRLSEIHINTENCVNISLSSSLLHVARKILKEIRKIRRKFLVDKKQLLHF